MKKLFLRFCRDAISKNQGQYNDEKLEEIMYGLEVVYILITKTIIVFSVAFVLGIFRETFLLMLFYGFLRVFGYGVHAGNSFICLLISLVIFLSIGSLCSFLFIPFLVKVIMCLFSFISILIYAPADTEKKPLVNKNKRKMLKFLSIILSVIYIFLIFVLNNFVSVNVLLFALILESVMILPITYKLFNQKYKNYVTYLKKCT
jgi:accessory gene regulator B